MKEINKIIYEKNKENNNSDNNSTLNAQKILFSEEAQDKMNNIKTNKIIMPYGNTAKLIEGENDDFDYFTEFISIIINDFLYFPNYFHSYNIENIYRFFMNQNNFGAKIKYLNKSNQDIQLFGSKFVRDNEKNFSIIINESIEDIKQFHKFDAKEALVEIYLTDKIKKNRRHKIEKIKNMFQDCESLIEVEFNFNGYERSKDLSHLFDGCKSLIKVPECIINWVKNNCDDISYIFSNCYSLKELPDISQWKTSNVYKMKGVFCGCKSLKYLPDISDWDTKDIEDMSYMFSNCTNLRVLPNISNWNTKNLTKTVDMFSNCPLITLIPDLSKWNIRSVVDISGMFENCCSLQNLDFLAKWDAKNINNMSQLFYGCSKLKKPNLEKWNIDKRESNTIKEMFKLINSEEKKLINIINTNNIKNLISKI